MTHPSGSGGALRRDVVLIFVQCPFFLFATTRMVCADPFERYKKLIRKNVKEALQILINSIKDGRIQMLFLPAKLRRDPKSISEIKNLDEARNSPSSPAKSSSSTDTSASSLLARAKRNAECLMPLLGILPFRASRFGNDCSMMQKKFRILYT